MSFARRRSTYNADSSVIGSPTRTFNYGEAMVVPAGVARQAIASQGAYYTALNATVGTALTGHAAPAIADTYTKPIIHLYNANTSQDVFLDYIRIMPVTVNASSTASDFLVYVDKNTATGRASGGTAITPGNCLGGGGAAGSVVYAGAVVASATVTTPVKVFQWTVRPVIAVTLDQYVFQFGEGIVALPASAALTGTSVTTAAVSGPPVVIPPTGNLYFSFCGPSGASTAMTFEFEMGFYEL